MFSVSTSGYYERCSRVPSQRNFNDRIMTELIRQIHAMSNCSYGRIRVQAELQDIGLYISSSANMEDKVSVSLNAPSSMLSF